MIVLIAIALVVVAAIFAPGVLLAALKVIAGPVVKAVIAFGVAGLVLGFGNTYHRSSCYKRSCI